MANSICVDPAHRCGCTPAGCSPCDLPQRNLTVATHTHFGDATPATMVYTPPGTWASGCTNGMLYFIACVAGVVQFKVRYFVSGGCPGGQSQECVSGGTNPYGLTLSSYTCSGPFQLNYAVNDPGCPALADNGVTGFTVT